MEIRCQCGALIYGSSKKHCKANLKIHKHSKKHTELMEIKSVSAKRK